MRDGVHILRKMGSVNILLRSPEKVNLFAGIFLYIQRNPEKVKEKFYERIGKNHPYQH